MIPPLNRDPAQAVQAGVFEFSFEGRLVTARDGQTIGAALLAAGVRTLRITRGDGRPRGMFCGIGVCFDCLVTVDGQTARACLCPARPGQDVRAGAQVHGD
jgi:predicted molibdopterin-dependent oxidoreductase YjgC